MKQWILIILLLISFNLFAAEEDASVALLKVRVNVHDRASVERGAKFFANNCLACHTMRYVEHNKLAQAAGITLDKMPLKNKEWWLGIVPPDLSLMAKIRGADWLYTYFHTFYKDASRPTGFNNLVLKNSNMTNVFLAYQGEQVLIPQYKSALDESFHHRKPPYYSVLKLVQSGTMSSEEFDQTMTDLVNFLVYVSEPKQIQRENMGVWVLLFLAVLFVFAFLLYKTYWKKIKSEK